MLESFDKRKEKFRLEKETERAEYLQVFKDGLLDTMNKGEYPYVSSQVPKSDVLERIKGDISRQFFSGETLSDQDIVLRSLEMPAEFGDSLMKSRAGGDIVDIDECYPLLSHVFEVKGRLFSALSAWRGRDGRREVKLENMPVIEITDPRHQFVQKIEVNADMPSEQLPERIEQGFIAQVFRLLQSKAISASSFVLYTTARSHSIRVEVNGEWKWFLVDDALGFYRMNQAFRTYDMS